MYLILLLSFAHQCGMSNTVMVWRLPAAMPAGRMLHSRRHVLLQSMRRLQSMTPEEALKKYMDSLKQDVKDSHIGPLLTDDYNPSRGYEPYWIGGEWVLEELKKNKTEGLCGSDCSPVYKRYGEICGRNGNNVYKTFENYCGMKSIDCDNEANWLIAYRGPCRDPHTLKTYGTISFRLSSRALDYISKFYANTATTKCYHPNPFVCLAKNQGPSTPTPPKYPPTPRLL